MKTCTEIRARDAAQLSATATALRLDVTRWALAAGQRVDYDALSAILAAKSEVPAPVRRWTEDDVWRLWWVDLSSWCSLRRVRTPDGLATTMLTVLRHLDATGSLAVGSDTLVDLEVAMESTGALWRDPTANAG